MKRCIMGIAVLAAALAAPAADWLEWKFEVRHRFEYQNDFDFDASVDDQQGFHLFRARLGAALRFGKGFGALVQVQDARMADGEFASTAPYQDELDLHQGYGEWKGGKASARLGRQELSYGEERLIGAFGWSNLGQSFDAVKGSITFGTFKVDLFGGRRVVPEDDEWNRWDDEDALFGAYGSYKHSDALAWEPYILHRDTDKAIAFGPHVGSGALGETTAGSRFTGRFGGGFDYTFEAAFQFGSFGDQDISAYALIAMAGYTFRTPWAPRVVLEWDLGSGDDDPADDTRGTFDNLFPTNHKFYGFMDRASLQNLDNLHLGLSAKPSAALTLQADLHHLRLDTAADSLYNAGRKAVRTASDPSAPTTVGTEVDLTATFQAAPWWSVLVGWSAFNAGSFLEATGAADDGQYFYLQSTFKY